MTKMMGHDEFLIHQRRARFASARYDFKRLPVEGSAAYEGRKGPAFPVKLADAIVTTGIWAGILCLAYRLARFAWVLA